jgi:hypothetical protein
MIGLTVKNIIIKKQLKKFFKVPGVLFCTIFEDCLNADWLVYWCAPWNSPDQSFYKVIERLPHYHVFICLIVRLFYILNNVVMVFSLFGNQEVDIIIFVFNGAPSDCPSSLFRLSILICSTSLHSDFYIYLSQHF